jgi:hypothetical protein
MSYEPYRPPQDFSHLTPTKRTPAVVATAVSAGLASVYWLLVALLLGFAAKSGATSPLQVILPFVLVALYGYRGLQAWKGDGAAIRNLLFLHVIGGLMAVYQVMNSAGFAATLNIVKVAIHVLGLVSTGLALRPAPPR